MTSGILATISKRGHTPQYIFVSLKRLGLTGTIIPLEDRAAAKDSTNAILNHILEHRLIDKIKERICAELETAASIVEAHNMTGLAREFRCLAHPLRNNGST